MRVLYVVDVHGRKEACDWIESNGKSYDLIVVGGDLSTFSDTSFVNTFLNSALRAGKDVIYVPGNNDPEEAKIPDGVNNIHGKKLIVNSTSFGGLGGSNITPFGTRFEIDDQKARRILESLGSVKILVSHCPPARTKCDLIGGKHIGSVPVREYVEKQMPEVVLTGHVHEARAVDKIGNTTIVNPGPLMHGYYAELTLGSINVVELKAVASWN